MAKRIIKYCILFLVYLSLFFLIDLIPLPWLELKVAIFIVIGILSLNYVDKRLNALLYRYSLRFTRHLERVMAEFDAQLNKTYNYYEFIDELKKFFNLISKNRSWVFYVAEDDHFYIAATAVSIARSSLPTQIDRSQFNRLEFAHVLADLNVPDLNGYDYAIIFPGKNNQFGVLFSKASYFNFLNDVDLAAQFQSVTIKAGQVLENTALYYDLLEKNRQIKKVFEVSEKILTSLNTDQILDFLLEALDEIIEFDAGVIFLFDAESEKLYRSASKGYQDESNLTLKMGQGACGWVAQTKKPSILEDVATADYYYPARGETQSQVALPLQIHDELIGVLCLESNQLGYFNQKSHEILNLFANQAVIALNNARQYEISLKKQQLEHELIRAGKIQQVLLPNQPPKYDKLNIAFAHLPSQIVSGDLFDLAALSDQNLAFVIGDVSGKGAHAAIMMSLVLAGFRAYRKTHVAVCEVVARLNNLLEESTIVGNYTTLFYSMISLEQNTIVYTNAGHNPPYLIRSNGTITELSGGGIMIGFMRDQVYTQHEVPFETNDILVAYTDGITEVMNHKEQEFGEERLKQLLSDNRHLSSYDLKNKILEEVSEYSDQQAQADDITIVTIKHT